MVRFENYNFSYAGSLEEVLKDINITFEKGGFYLVCGESGCGKTTLLRQMKKELIPEGNIRGQLYTETANFIGYVGQDPESMIVTDTVWHELAFGLENQGMAIAKMQGKIGEFSQFFGLTDVFLKDTSTLSGGQRQLLCLASVMVMQPELLLLDEPTAQLDPLAATDFIHMLKRINEELGTTIIICEHRLEELFSLSDKIVLMSRGRIEKYATPDEMAYYLSSKGESARLYEGLPTSVRLFSKLHGKGKCPIALKDTRQWFESEYAKRDFPITSEEVKDFGEPIIRMKDVFFQYDADGPKVLRGTKLDVYKGKWQCLLGGNGAGKSTLIQVLAQILMTDRGKLYYKDNICDKKNPMPLGWKHVVMLPQNPKVIFSEITVEEELEIMLGAPYRKAREVLGQENKQELIECTLKQMELEQKKTCHPYDLSGGQQQKLALAKLLLLEPEVLILDEPTKGMDPGFKPEFAAIIKKLQEKGMTIFMVSHDVEFAAEYTDICGLLFDGQVVGNNWTNEFFAGNNFYTTNTNRIVRKLLPKAVTIREVHNACTME